MSGGVNMDGKRGSLVLLIFLFLSSGRCLRLLRNIHEHSMDMPVYHKLIHFLRR